MTSAGEYPSRAPGPHSGGGSPPGGHRGRILVAEDDRSMRELVERILTEAGHEVVAVPDGLAAIARLRADAPVQPDHGPEQTGPTPGRGPSFDVVLTDVRMPGADGIQVLGHVRRNWPGMPVVVLTAFGSIPGAVDAMRLGAFDYLTKPLPDPQALRDVVDRALQAAPTEGQRATVTSLVAQDPAMEQVVAAARQVATAGSTVLLLGESGTGKEVVGRLIHDSSKRSAGPFVAVNCAALNENLLESELFGHERGAFTGADSRHEGRFEQADGGTLMLDEVGETSPALQVKLLRVLQERRFQRVGGEREVSVDVRIIAATNRDLEAMVARGEFREDLFYRLAVFPIQIPPLRERRQDVIPLAEHFLHLLSRGPERSQAELTDEARAALLEHRWPGNVRELQNVLERAVILRGGAPLRVEDLGLRGDRAAEARPNGTLKEMERRAIEAAIEAEGGNRRRAAKRLGIALRTLQYKLKDYGIS